MQLTINLLERGDLDPASGRFPELVLSTVGEKGRSWSTTSFHQAKSMAVPIEVPLADGEYRLEGIVLSPGKRGHAFRQSIARTTPLADERVDLKGPLNVPVRIVAMPYDLDDEARWKEIATSRDELLGSDRGFVRRVDERYDPLFADHPALAWHMINTARTLMSSYGIDLDVESVDVIPVEDEAVERQFGPTCRAGEDGCNCDKRRGHDRRLINIYLMPTVSAKFGQFAHKGHEHDPPPKYHTHDGVRHSHEAEHNVRGFSCFAGNSAFVSMSRGALNTCAHELGHLFGLDDVRATADRNLMTFPSGVADRDEIGSFTRLSPGQQARMWLSARSFLQKSDRVKTGIPPMLPDELPPVSADAHPH